MKAKREIVCFGELLLRVVRGQDWPAESCCALYLGGAEYNVAVALANWQQAVRFVSALPNNAMTESIVESIEKRGVRSYIRRTSESRMGLVYAFADVDMKSPSVIYDRQQSAFASLPQKAINWHTLLPGAAWIHISAITPAVSELAFQHCLDALRTANELGLTTSIDLNYREALWQNANSPVERIRPLTELCDWVMGNIWSAEKLLGIPLDNRMLTSGVTHEVYHNHARQSANLILEQFERCRAVAFTFRLDHKGKDIHYFASLVNRHEHYQSKSHVATRIVNRVGSGDCFMAGLIYGQINGMAPQEILEYATSAAFGHLHESSDTTSQGVNEVMARY